MRNIFGALKTGSESGLGKEGRGGVSRPENPEKHVVLSECKNI